jgi:site-specific recombinase XerD
MDQEFIETERGITFSVAHRDGPEVTVCVPTVARQDAPFLRMWLRNQRSARTQETYAANIQRFYTCVGKALPEVTLADLQDFAEQLSSLAPASQTCIIAAVRSALTFCYHLGYVQRNVGAALKLPRLEKKLAGRILTEEQVVQMLALEKDQRNHAILTLLYGAGLRVNELCELTWSQVQTRSEMGQITVRGKGGKTRSILLSQEIWQEITALRSSSPSNTNYIFLSRQSTSRVGKATGRRLDGSQIHRIVKAAAERAGISGNVSPHWLRHAHASHALQRGAPLTLVQETLGHESVETTGRYIYNRPNTSSALYLSLEARQE